MVTHKAVIKPGLLKGTITATLLYKVFWFIWIPIAWIETKNDPHRIEEELQYWKSIYEPDLMVIDKRNPSTNTPNL